MEFNKLTSELTDSELELEILRAQNRIEIINKVGVGDFVSGRFQELLLELEQEKTRRLYQRRS